MTYDVVVVGSGPGGAVTARECARRGLKVLVLEEGDRHEPGTVPPYSLAQMRRMYRNHGLTVALGRPSIAYTEARCVGGGSEVNAGLYHRPDPTVLAEWTARFDIEALTPGDLEPWHRVVEKRLQVEVRRPPLPAASEALRRAAEQLGWAGLEVPRWATVDANGRPTMHTMQRTYLDDALEAGCDIRPGTRVRRLEISGGAVRRVVCDSGESVVADRVVVSAGTTADAGAAATVGRRRTIRPRAVGPSDRQGGGQVRGACHRSGRGAGLPGEGVRALPDLGRLGEPRTPGRAGSRGHLVAGRRATRAAAAQRRLLRLDPVVRNRPGARRTWSR